MVLVIAPEGTRRRAPWKSGFYRIALAAGVPIVLCGFDYSRRVIFFAPAVHADWRLRARPGGDPLALPLRDGARARQLRGLVAPAAPGSRARRLSVHWRRATRPGRRSALELGEDARAVFLAVRLRVEVLQVERRVDASPSSAGTACPGTCLCSSSSRKPSTRTGSAIARVLCSSRETPERSGAPFFVVPAGKWSSQPSRIASSTRSTPVAGRPAGARRRPPRGSCAGR